MTRGDTAHAQASPLQLLQVEGALESDDETMSGDGSFFDRHTFEGEAGQAIAISLESEAFDTYLLLLDAEGNAIAQDDDGGEGTNALIQVELPATGTYTVLANSYEAGATGNYMLVVQQVDSSELEGFQQALAEAREEGDRTAELEALSDMANYYGSREAHLESIEYLQQQLSLAKTLGNRDYEIAAYQLIPARYVSFVTRNNAEAYRLLDSDEIELAQQRLTENIKVAEETIPIVQQGLLIVEGVQIEDIAPEEILTTMNLNLAQIYQGLGQAYQLMGNSYLKVQNLEEARRWAQQSIEIGQQAIASGQKALELAEEKQDTFRFLLANKILASIFNGIIGDSSSVQAWVFLNEGSFQEEINALQQSLAARQSAVPFAVASENEYLQTLIQGNISNTYDRIGTAYRELGDYENSIAATEQALAIARQLGNQHLEWNSLLGLDK
ncbi:MAG: PPC domain-containing protein [Elainellaceae cyanobacterium]